MDETQCTHGDDTAVHQEVLAWADDWAKRLHEEAPPIERDSIEHTRHEMTRLMGSGSLGEVPERFRGCGLSLKNLIKDALADLHGALEKEARNDAE